MTYENIKIEQNGDIRTVILNRPEQLNALSGQLLREYVDALKAAEQDAAVKVVVVKGAGRSFCAGYDATDSSTAFDYNSNEQRSPFVDDKVSLDFLWGASSNAWSLSKPVIAQVHGHCVAGGNDIAGQCDIVIAAENAVFQQPQVRRLGLSFNHMFPYKCGPQWAKILLLTGDPISGIEAEQLGLAAYAVPEAELEEAVLKLARRLALIDPTMMTMNKLAVNRAFEAMGLPQAREAANALDTIAHTAHVMNRFTETAIKNGLKAALDENEGPFRAAERPFKLPRR